MSVPWNAPTVEAPPTPTAPVAEIDMRRAEWGYLIELLMVCWTIGALTAVAVLVAVKL